MGIIAATTWNRAMTAAGGALALGVLLSAWNQVSPGARALSRLFADRADNVWHQRARDPSALALLSRVPNDDGVSKPATAAPIADDIPDARLSPSLRSTRPAAASRTPRNADPTTASSPIGQAGSMIAANNSDTSIFTLPNVSDLAIPAAIGLGALSLDLSLKSATDAGAPSFFTPAWSSSTLGRPSAAPAAATNALTLPGPFHVFVTTQPMGGAAPPAGEVANNGVVNMAGNGNGNGLVSGMGNGPVSGIANGLGNGLINGVVNGDGNGSGNRGNGLGNGLGLGRR